MSLFLEHARSTDLYKTLCAVFASDDGNLLERTDIKTAEAQTEFLRWALHVAGPQTMIETGTNKGMFLYFVSLVARGVTIHTFDSDARAAQAVELINKAQQNVVAVFHEGDTRETLREANVAAQFAWIDGGHEGDIPLNDLMQCYRLRVPFVAVDDTSVTGTKKGTTFSTVEGTTLREYLLRFLRGDFKIDRVLPYLLHRNGTRFRADSGAVFRAGPNVLSGCSQCRRVHPKTNAVQSLRQSVHAPRPPTSGPVEAQ